MANEIRVELYNFITIDKIIQYVKNNNDTIYWKNDKYKIVMLNNIPYIKYGNYNPTYTKLLKYDGSSNYNPSDFYIIRMQFT